MNTRKALSETMKRLMCEKNFNAISVKSICESCGINRKSFYYHYRDKFDLVNDIYCLEFYNDAVKRHRNNIQSFIDELCAYIADNRQFYRNAFNVEGQNSFKDCFCDSLLPMLEKRVALREFSEKESRALARYYAVMIAAAITHWLGEKNPMSAQAFARCLRTLFAWTGDGIMPIKDYSSADIRPAYAYN